MACVEDALQHREGVLPGRPLPVDAPVPEPVLYAQRMTTHPAPHRRVVSPGLDVEVAPIPVDHLPGPGEVDPAVVGRGRSHLQVPYQSSVGVHLGVELVAERRPLPPLRPRAVPAPAGPSVLLPWLPGWAWVYGDERGVLATPFLTRRPFSSICLWSSSHSSLSFSVEASLSLNCHTVE